MKNTIIVFGGSTNALGQIRASHEAGYRCINIVEDCMHSWSRKSNLCEGYLAPHPFNEKEKCLAFIKDIIAKIDSKPFLLFASDDWMTLIGENEAEFKKIANIPQLAWEKMSNLYDKKYLYRIAEEKGIPYPRTKEIESLKELADTISDLQAPYIVKPQETTSANLIAKAGIKAFHRTQKFETKEDLIKWVNTLLEHNVDFPLLLQEFIPGDATALYTLTSYSDKNGDLVAGSVGHKLRQFPPVAGRITSGVLEHNNEMFELGRDFLKAVGYHGLANTEFKYDKRDGKFKLMEINTRLGAWNYSTLFAGLNLVKIAVDDTLGKKYDGPEYLTDKDGKIWYNFLQDFSGAVIMNGRIGEKAFQLSPWQWRKSLKGISFEAIWSWRDPKPFVFSFLYLAKKAFS